MPIKITVSKATETTPPPQKKLLITVGKKDQLVEPDAQASINLAARRTLDGSILISDHPLLDILLQPANSKIVAFSKKNFGDEVYASQSRLFDFLSKKGVISHDSVQGGNVHGTLEAKYPEIEDRSALEAVLLTVGKWVNAEKAAELEMKNYEQEVEDLFLHPPDEETTELGEKRPEPLSSPQKYYQSARTRHGSMYGLSEQRGKDA
jgi:hypothetical protein